MSGEGKNMVRLYKETLILNNSLVSVLIFNSSLTFNLEIFLCILFDIKPNFIQQLVTVPPASPTEEVLFKLSAIAEEIKVTRVFPGLEIQLLGRAFVWNS